MDERKIIERLAEIRRLARPAPVAIEAIDALMQEMTFGDWPDDPARRIVADPPPAHTRPARPPGYVASDPAFGVSIVDATEQP